MTNLYDRTDIYDLLENKSQFDAYQKHWESLLQGKNIHTFLDVSIGSGSVTLPILNLGIQLSGSDLNKKMLKKCRCKSQNMKHEIELKCSDFRDLSCWKGQEFDCVASTGNSLPHVENHHVLTALEQMDALIKPGGYLYFDTRNWDKILKERPRFYLYDPILLEEQRVNLVQVWDYHSDNSMTFNLLYTFEKDNKIFQKEKFEEHYYPIARDMLLKKLNAMGYAEIKIQCFPSYFEMPEFEHVEWYCVMGKKMRTHSNSTVPGTF